MYKISRQSGKQIDSR